MVSNPWRYDGSKVHLGMSAVSVTLAQLARDGPETFAELSRSLEWEAVGLDAGQQRHAGRDTVEALYAVSKMTPCAARASSVGVSKCPPLA